MALNVRWQWIHHRLLLGKSQDVMLVSSRPTVLVLGQRASQVGYILFCPDHVFPASRVNLMFLSNEISWTREAVELVQLLQL